MVQNVVTSIILYSGTAVDLLIILMLFFAKCDILHCISIQTLPFSLPFFLRPGLESMGFSWTKNRGIFLVL